MASRDILNLTPETQEKFREFEMRMGEAALPFIVTCTSRSVVEQDALYSQGRCSLWMVNRIRGMAGMQPITIEQNARPVTWTMVSRHIVNERNPLSEAFDIALTRPDRVHWDLKIDVNGNEIPDYLEAARIGLKCGLVPGAYFTKPDYCHFQNSK